MAIRAETGFSLKDHLFNSATVGVLAERLVAANPQVDGLGFAAAACAPFPELELKARISHIVTTLHEFLPGGYADALATLERTLPPPLDPTLTDDDFGEYIWVVPGEYAARYGCTPDYLDQSLAFLRVATMRFSSESALRPFLRAFPDATMAAVNTWVTDANYHVRRLASEGIRPNLPWAIRAPLPAERIIAVLDSLHADRTRYVTRSVANTLNDIAKDDPLVVLEAVTRWREEARQAADELTWMSRHALRTLVKADHADTLEFLGYTLKPRFQIDDDKVTARVSVGEHFRWSCRLTSLAEQRLKVSLRLHLLKARGQHGVKVFAVKDGLFGRGEVIEINKRQAFKPITTRTLYPGQHFAELVVNGVVHERVAFDLVDER